MSWEETFRGWAAAPSATEQEKAENAERGIAKAVAANAVLQHHSPRVYSQGSYRNRTNVRLESDVDIGVLCEETFFYDLADGMAAADVGITPPSYSFNQYKSDLHQALNGYFGRGSVTRGDKAFDVHANSYRVDADVVACFPYRWYQPDGTFVEGRAFLTESGNRIHNYPEQNYDNGVAKNDRTSRGFKATVRILKRLCNKMADESIAAAKATPSYLIECLAWNVPDEGFMHETHRDDVRYALATIFNETRQGQGRASWVEINGIKYLFHVTQPWTLATAHDFASAAWDYIGFQ